MDRFSHRQFVEADLGGAAANACFVRIAETVEKSSEGLLTTLLVAVPFGEKSVSIDYGD
ncbi:hypothetical protein [Roseovarius tolerans]|uniref:hypothetical protein n=1 Tax=Roseovarius tolerans TaxID=74031 RepID=UPI001F27A0EB|nr:hypothetical protein [Roseovarius tolerans]